MTDFPGMGDNETDAGGDGLSVVENMSYFVKGELGRRLGFGARIANTGMVCGEINGYVVFVKSNGNIESESQ